MQAITEKLQQVGQQVGQLAKDTIEKGKEALERRKETMEKDSVAGNDLASNIDPGHLRQMQEAIQQTPIKSKVKYHITSILQNDHSIRNEAVRFEIGNDAFQHTKTLTVNAGAPRELLGGDTAPDPSELLLAAMGSSLAMAFIRICACEGVKLTRCEVKVKGKIDLNQNAGEAAGAGFRSICAKFSVELAENVEKQRLRDMIHQARMTADVAQTINKGVKICVCLKGEKQEAKSRFGLLRQFEAEEKERSRVRTHGQIVPTQAEGAAVEVAHLEGFQQLEGVKFLRPGETVSPYTSPERDPSLGKVSCLFLKRSNFNSCSNRRNCSGHTLDFITSKNRKCAALFRRSLILHEVTLSVVLGQPTASSDSLGGLPAARRSSLPPPWREHHSHHEPLA